ncbi:MAG: DUF4249 domain-containing protein [Bacteroidota bacterium]
MKYNISMLLIALLSLTACQDVVTVEIENFEELLVIEGGITHRIDGTNNQQTIQLSKTSDFFDQNANGGVEDAAVTVTDGSNFYDFEHIDNGIYIADISTRIGATYTLNIEYNGQFYEATETLVDVPQIDSIYAVFEEESIFADEGYVTRIDTEDPAGQANYYHWKVFKNGVFVIVPDLGNQTNLIASDQFFDGQPLVGIEPNEEVLLEIGDEVRVEQHGISERYHNYLDQLLGQTGGGPGFGNPPPGRIKGNVVNATDAAQAAVGYFAVTAVAEATLVVE